MYVNKVVNVLDKGYVTLIDHMGSDLSIVSAARASYEQDAMWEDPEAKKLYNKDAGLIKYLIKNKHWSPFRHAVVTFEFKAPLMVARQHWKHVVASSFVDDQYGYNEASHRYIKEAEEFYIPSANEWRSKPENSKQGSGPKLETAQGEVLTDMYVQHVRKSVEAYEEALDIGVAPEQARIFLPAYALYVKYRWTGSLQSIINFLELRLAKDAQAEFTPYAQAVQHLTYPLFPVTMDAWNLDPSQ